MLAVVVSVTVLGAVVGGSPLLTSRARRQIGAVFVMGPFEEMRHPSAQRARPEVEVAEERRVPAPSPYRLPGLGSVPWAAPGFRAPRVRR